MLFHTAEFFVFIVAVFLVYQPLRNTRFSLLWLLAASYFFYGWWNPLYLLLIVYSTALDYVVVWCMDRSGKKKRWLLASIVNNLLLLGFFKYGEFVTDQVNLLLGQLGASLTIPAPGVLLPVGISFYTFQSMSYTIDFYRGNIERERSFVRFAAFVALFPQLVAGPIERARNLLPQLNRPTRFSKEDLTDGLSLFVVGLFKKVALADYLALYVDKVYSAPSYFDGLSLALATFAFGWQIYFDFSGYTDMARGVARMMGFNLTLNFNHPYLATSLGDFWKRWHISLSAWFKDYLYIPLGGSRRGTLGICRNIILTMVISGLWHGVGWTFIIWGFLHALAMCATRTLERTPFYEQRVPGLVKRLWVFAFVTFAWIFFRAENVGDAATIVSRIFSAGFADPQFPLLALLLCLGAWLYQFLLESKARRFLAAAPVRIGVMFSMIAYLLFFSGSSSAAFIYFQF